MSNLEELLKKCLEFYADPKNHTSGMIAQEGGKYANDILSLYKTIKDNVQKEKDVFDSITDNDANIEQYVKKLSDLL
jgi:hypothetical protein